MIKSSFLKPWLEGKYPLPDLDDLSLSQPDLDFLIWLAVNYKVPYHEINNTKILGLGNAWTANRSYYHKAISLVQQYEPGMRLDGEERLEILETLGDPPDVSHPIYIIAVEDGASEEIVYVGKSASNLSRFSGGHSTAMKLLDPKYNNHKKYVYLCQVMLYSTNDEYLPLEFAADKKLALELLDDVESMLINDFKSAFNIMKMKSYSVNHKFTLQIQKSFSDSKAVEDKFIYAKF